MPTERTIDICMSREEKRESADAIVAAIVFDV